jgi:hypothetical protein
VVRFNIIHMKLFVNDEIWLIVTVHCSKCLNDYCFGNVLFHFKHFVRKLINKYNKYFVVVVDKKQE